MDKVTANALLKKEEIVIAGILDELSEASFLKACQFTNLDCISWREQVEASPPLFLFVESAWRGKENSWYQKITHVQKELYELVSWCKQRKILTVFWNKEDPVQFQTFFSAAALFDWVFTTALDCVPLYKKLLGHSQVGYLPFAAEVTQYNPVVKGERKQGVCFAGAYYARQEERCREFHKLYKAISLYLPVELYARMPGGGNPDYSYPKQYEKSIKGTVPVSKMDEVYKSYKYAITINTVKRSSTMFARRAVEIGACNTLLVSNDCRGLHTLFGDLIIYMQEEKQFKKTIASLQRNEHYYRKIRLALYRKIMLEHTYEQRINYLCSRVLGKEITKVELLVLVYSVITDERQARAIWKQFVKQTYKKKSLVFLWKKEDSSTDITEYKDADYYCYFSPNNYYGANYIMDCMLALNYVKTNIIGKGKYITYQDGIYIENSCEEYQYGEPIYYDRCIVSREAAKEKKELFLEDTFAIDCLNFCEGYCKSSCDYVDDLVIEKGKEIKELYALAEVDPEDKIIKFQYQISPKEFKASLHYIDKTLEVKEIEGKGVVIDAGVRKLNDLYATSELRFSVQDYAKEGRSSIFVEAEKQGDAAVVLNICNNNKQILKMILLQLNGFTEVNMPNEAKEFYFSVKIGSHAEIILKNIAINLNIR
ncbi:MAG: glycosyltransferase [bacterium]|nr:glycosyltransferase [bacterium]